MKPLILAVVGPTACGKTGLSLKIATQLQGEIVCMDSMQIYRGMDIGTAKPTEEEKNVAPHHMLDVADPKESYSVACYRTDARRCIEDILRRGRLPILVGGTGMYLRALSLPLSYGGTAENAALRARYEEMARTEGNAAVHAALQKADPETAKRLHPNDLRRVIRALEVYETTGVPLSRQKMPSYEDGDYRILPFMPMWDKEKLHQRINERVSVMIKAGLKQEVRGLLESGVQSDDQSMQGIGYKEMIPCVEGIENLENTAEEIRLRTRQYAKRQLTWFRADKRVRPLEAARGENAMLSAILSAVTEEMNGY